MAGRPRSRELDAALGRATADLLGRVGYHSTTVDAVAALAGVPKSTLYRRWSSKAELVFATVVHSDDISVPDTGRLDSDLLELSRRIVAALDHPTARLALPGLLADLVDDAGLRARFHHDVTGAQRRLVQQVLDRATERGELAEPPDAADLHAQLLGTAYAWTVLINEPTPADLPARLAAAALATLTPSTPRTQEDTTCSTT